jgi:hypothetical protein
MYLNCMFLRSIIPLSRKKMVPPLEKKFLIQYIYQLNACELNNKVLPLLN